MPITTPRESLAHYQADEHHFRHVFAHLFEPAIERAGMQALPPLSQGANLVHAEIVDKIIKSDLVLCDMSGLNPNVFFEMGIRTALNQPLCFVVDDITEAMVPFDTGIVNYHVYGSHLAAWTLEQEVDALAAHLSTTITSSEEGNALWKYFGLRTQYTREQAQHWSATSGDALAYLTLQVEALGRKLDNALSGVAIQPKDRARLQPAPPDALGDIDVTTAVLPTAVDPALASTDLLVTLRSQLSARLSRSRTRAEEVAIDSLLTRIESELNKRASPS